MGLLDNFDLGGATRGLLEFIANTNPEIRAERAQAEERKRQAERQRIADQMAQQQFEMQRVQFDQQRGLLAQQQADEGLLKRGLLLPEMEGARPADGMGPGAPMANKGIDPQWFLSQGGSVGGLGKALEMNKALFPSVRPTDSLAKINPADYTPESFAQFMASGDYGKLVPYRKPDTPSTPTERQLFELAQKDPEFAKFLESRRPGPSTVIMGSPVPVELPGGGVGYAQPANKPGVAPSLMVGPGNVPLRKPNEAKTGPATEDERKAAGWYEQAANAYRNMMRVWEETQGAAARPNPATDLVRRVPLIGEQVANAATDEKRQRFEQAASSFAEAALRAATGAGVTEQEARQKIRELTPQVGDKQGTIQQKARDMQVYLESLRLRAGRAASSTPIPRPPAGLERGAVAPPTDINALVEQYGAK